MVYVVAALGAWSVRFVQDDAFISFRYARNLANGHGLVFNPGERVEGYTNFLWTLFMAVPEWLGWSTPLFAQLVGIVVFLATVAVTWRLAERVLRDDTLALLAVLVLVTNMTFLSYATGGLETMLQTLLVVSFAAVLLPIERFGQSSLVGRHLAAGALAGLAVLTRLDSVVLLSTLTTVHVVLLSRRSPAGERATRAAIALTTMALPAAALVVPWLVWKLSFYGSLLPNTFEAKSGAGAWGQIVFALLYLAAFVVGYFYFLLIGRWRRHRHEFFSLPGARQVFWVVPVWVLYIVAAGADFMEFRFVVPIMPVLAMLGAVLIDPFTRTWRQIALIGALLLASYGHLALPSLGYPVHTFRDLDLWPSSSPSALGEVGERLAEQFPGGLEAEDQVLMAVGNLGVMPYFSQLPTIDMLGLADAHVARHGEPLEAYYPGHLQVAPIDYLVDREAQLVSLFRIEHPQEPERVSYRLSELVELYPVVDLHDLPETATVLELPMQGELIWPVIYLTPHPAVDDAVARNNWRVLPIERVCDPDDLNPLVKIFGSATCD
jgi:arabinofuranosyltransferase